MSAAKAATYTVTTPADSDADIGAFGVVQNFDKDWGINEDGQLGLGNTNTPQVTPQSFASFPDITQFGGGYLHSVALRSNGTVVTSGYNLEGQLGDGTIAQRSTFGQVLLSAGGANFSDVVAVSGGALHNLALKSDGTVWAWGFGGEGQLGNGANASSNVPVQVGASVAGFNEQVVAIDAGLHYNLALTADGKVWAWGDNLYSQLGDGTQTNRNLPQAVLTSLGGTQLTGIVQVSAGEAHSAALKTDGSVVVWGYNYDGEVGNGTTNTTGCECLKFPATTTSTAMGAVTSINAGTYHTVALKSDGTVWAWGYGFYGQIGDNNTADATTPRQTTISNAVEVRADNGYHTLARIRDGSVFVWGYNAYGQIGNGTTTDQLTPLNISLPQGTGGNLGTGVSVIGAGSFSSFAAIPLINVPTGTNVRVAGDNVRLIYSNVTTAGQQQIRAIDPTATGLTVPPGYMILSNSQAYDIVSNAQFSGTASVCLKIANVIDQTAFNKLFILHDDDSNGTLDAVIPTRDYQRREICRTTSSFSPFVVAQGLNATAATVTIGGRITSGKQGIRNIRVTLTDQNGSTRTVLSSQLGYYRFAEVEVGQTYTISVSGKKYSFANSTQIRSITEDTNDINFVADN